MSDKNIYQILTKNEKKTPIVKTTPVVLKEDDYEKGYITRYFARQVNSPKSDIIEINDKSYNKLISNPVGLYKVIQLDWKLTGDLNSKIINGVKHIGVFEANQNTIDEVKKELPGIELILDNLIKYYK